MYSITILPEPAVAFPVVAFAKMEISASPMSSQVPNTGANTLAVSAAATVVEADNWFAVASVPMLTAPVVELAHKASTKY